MSEAKVLPPLEAGPISVRHDNLCLASEDLLGKGRVRVTIESAGWMRLTLNDGTRARPVLKFKGKTKVLVLNATNIRRIKANLGYGEDEQSWSGKDIWIEAMRLTDKKGRPTTVFGDRTHGIVVHTDVPPQARKAEKATEK